MRLIDADALKSEFEWLKSVVNESSKDEIQEYIQRIENAPTVDALPLRCRIGDTVWIVGTKCMSGLYDNECPDENERYSCGEFCEDCPCPLNRENIVFPRKVNSYNFTFIHDLEHSDNLRWGETVFKTKEEAEAALAKMGGDSK